MFLISNCLQQKENFKNNKPQNGIREVLLPASGFGLSTYKI